MPCVLRNVLVFVFCVVDRAKCKCPSCVCAATLFQNRRGSRGIIAAADVSLITSLKCWVHLPLLTTVVDVIIIIIRVRAECVHFLRQQVWSDDVGQCVFILSMEWSKVESLLIFFSVYLKSTWQRASNATCMPHSQQRHAHKSNTQS